MLQRRHLAPPIDIGYFTVTGIFFFHAHAAFSKHNSDIIHYNSTLMVHFSEDFVILLYMALEPSPYT
jgi:hypothetical protein